MRLKYWEAGLLAGMREDRRDKPSATVDVNVQFAPRDNGTFFHAYGNQPLIAEGNVMAIFKDKTLIYHHTIHTRAASDSRNPSSEGESRAVVPKNIAKAVGKHQSLKYVYSRLSCCFNAI